MFPRIILTCMLLLCFGKKRDTQDSAFGRLMGLDITEPSLL